MLRIPHARRTSSPSRGARYLPALQRPKPDGPGHSRHFRPDIEGLRAVAVVAVLLYHAGLPFAKGGYVGVDIFFVISGFLITRLLLREVETNRTLSISRFYVRRIKRLLPAAVVVLASVAALSWLLLAPLRRSTVSLDVVAAGLYGANWRMAAEAVNYFTAGMSASPVLHFWSLSVEEQFYLLWPALIVAVTWWHRRAGKNVRQVLAVTLVAVALSSFTYGVLLTFGAPRTAYFSTFSRGWELALGGLLAVLLASSSRLPRRLPAPLALAGMGAIAWSVVTFDDLTLFPGFAALAPTLGVAAIIVAGSAAPDALPVRLLAIGPMRYVGRISYSWYLWHWPLLVFATVVWGELSALAGLAVVAAAWLPTELTHRLIEEPFRRSRTLAARPRRAFQLGAGCTATVAMLGAVVYAATPSVPTMPPHQVVGAAALYQGGGTQPEAEGVRPNPVRAKSDRGQMYEDGCLVMPSGIDSPECVYGDPSSDTTVVLFGDSHAMQWFPALNELAEQRGWRLVGLTKSGCPAADVRIHTPAVDREYRECDKWRKNALDRIEAEDPDLLVASGLTTYRISENGQALDPAASRQALQGGYAAMFGELRRITGAQLAVLRDNPHPAIDDVPKCVSESLHRLRQCATPKERALNYPHTLAKAAQRIDGVTLIDPTPVLCRDGVCPAVIGNALVYRNADHMTATYVRTLSSWLGQRLPDL